MNATLILGGGGMLGARLAAALGGQGAVLFDRAFPEPPPPGRLVTGDIRDTPALVPLIAERPAVIYHLAAIVSGQAEQDFALGWDTNAQATFRLLEAIRAEHETSGGQWVPRLVFASSIAVFGPPLPAVIDDGFAPAPRTSYGAQKLACEVMLADYSRKGFIDAIALRLPTICVRPGAPNAAASGFFSSIIREPLAGRPAVLPVDDSVRHWHASPRAAVGFLLHAARLDTGLLEGRIALNMPGVSVSVAEQIAALREVAGERAVRLIERRPDPAIAAIVQGWPQAFAAHRARALGFAAERDFAEIIRIHIADEHG